MFKNFVKLNKELIANRRLIFSIGKKEFRNEYAGSALGIIWGLLKPFIMVLAYWFVFSVGLRQNDILGNAQQSVPYVAWLIPGVFAWTFFSDSLIMGSGAIRHNAHLVKKVVFPVSILPVIKIYTNLLNHFIFMAIALILLLLLKVEIQFYSIQLLYYMFAGIMFTLAVTRLFAAMAVMSVDVLHFISTIMQLLFWGTPVIWNPAGQSSTIFLLLKLNPYYYLVQGYRDSLFTGVWFFQQPIYTLYFWVLTFIIFLIGSAYYEKNRKEFADVL